MRVHVLRFSTPKKFVNEYVSSLVLSNTGNLHWFTVSMNNLCESMC